MDELRTQCERLEHSVHVRLNEIYSVVCQLPAKLGYSRGNAIKLIDWHGIETLLPDYFCETRLQLLAALKALSFKWPLYLREHFRHGQPFFVCEEKKWLLDNQQPQSFASNVVAGNTLRLTSMVIHNYPPEWGRDVVTPLSFHTLYYYCDGCLTAGRAR